MARKHLGEFEMLVLAAILRLGSKAYGVTVRREIERRVRRPVAVGALYTTLERLEDKGYVSSKVGAPTAVRGGRSKRYYSVRASGQKALRDAMTALSRMTEGLDVGWAPV